MRYRFEHSYVFKCLHCGGEIKQYSSSDIEAQVNQCALTVCPCCGVLKDEDNDIFTMPVREF